MKPSSSRIACWVCLLAALSLTVGCNDEIWAGDYDQSCDEDSDCVVVSEGDYCDRLSCHCPGAAINVDALDEWERDREDLYECESTVMCDCAAMEAFCNAGTCGTRPL